MDLALPPAPVLAVLDGGSTFSLYLTGAPGHHEVEAFIGGCFAAMHGARIRRFMPTLLALRDPCGLLEAGVGMRHGGEGRLFLEQYLDAPIEQVVARQIEQPVRRTSIVEVGNLAAATPGGARSIITALTDWLMAGGSRWVVFTGARLLVNSFRRMGIPLTPLAAADPRRLEPDGTDWGTYYDANPWVMAIEVPAAFDALAARGAFGKGAFSRNYGFGGTGVAA